MSASYYLTTTFNNCVPRRQLGSCSMTRSFLSAKGVACETTPRAGTPSLKILVWGLLSVQGSHIDRIMFLGASSCQYGKLATLVVIGHVTELCRLMCCYLLLPSSSALQATYILPPIPTLRPRNTPLEGKP